MSAFKLSNDLGQGVSRNYFTAMEFYVKTARGNFISAMTNIAFTFLNGDGVPVDKYKALEWFIKFGEKPEKVTHLTEEDRSRSCYELERCY